MLDLTLHLKDGFIYTDIYAKPTDSHLYLPFSSSHPFHCKQTIPYLLKPEQSRGGLLPLPFHRFIYIYICSVGPEPDLIRTCAVAQCTTC